MSKPATVLLFVEDDELIRNLVEPVLADAGFAVTTATRSDELFLCSRHGGPSFVRWSQISTWAVARPVGTSLGWHVI